MHSSSKRPLLQLIVAAVAGLVGLTACGSSATSTATTSVATVASTGGSTTETVSTDTTPDSTAITTAATDTAVSIEVDATSAVLLRPVLQCFVASSATGGTTTPTTTGVSFDATGSELLAAPDGETCQVGPPAGDGTVFDNDAEAVILSGQWAINVGLRSGPDGERVWNALTARCFAGDATCPTKRLAIEVDGAIVSAPTVNAPEFNGNVQISGAFTQADAERIASTLNAGAGG